MSPRMCETTVYLPRDLWQRVNQRAREEDRSISGLLRVAARDHLDVPFVPNHLRWQSFGRTTHVLVRVWGDEGEAACGRTGTVVPGGGGKACERCVAQLDRLQREAEC